MGKFWMKVIQLCFSVLLVFFLFTNCLASSNHIKNENRVIFLSSRRSGSNLITCSLLAITRKPVGKFFPNRKIHEVEKNLLELDLVSNKPFLYRTHQMKLWHKIPTHLNKLIFVTRNPKELLFREYKISSLEELQSDQVKRFIREYVKRFKIYESWCAHNRILVFYEDFIEQKNDEILLMLLHFMGEKPTFYHDFVNHREEYYAKILDKYTNYRQSRKQGKSSVDGPKAIYYTKNVDLELLRCVDEMLQIEAPLIWKKYLKRFQTN